MSHSNSSEDALAAAKQWAALQDQNDELRGFRHQFYIPSKADLKASTLFDKTSAEGGEPCIYLCGNSLGVQPKSTQDYVQVLLAQWRKKGVLAHFIGHKDSPLPSFLYIDDNAAKLMAPIVGAKQHEVAVMGTLTGNLHLMLSSFYRPTREGRGKYKILLEGKAFPSDHYAIESQIILAGYEPSDAMITLEPEGSANPILTTQQILQAIDREADNLALILLPGIQFYTGQFLDMKTITAHAHSRGILIGWDCAHAAGNIDLQLHDWEVDFAVWCTYKYLNSGPGAMGGLFVHERHGKVETVNGETQFRPRHTGWWGHENETRFQMTNKFVPRPGAAGFQLSNPSALDLAAVVASLKVFEQATITKLRQKSIRMTNFLEELLSEPEYVSSDPPYTIITPRDPQARGAQLSIKLNAGLLEGVLKVLESESVVIDERKPDVIRVAPAPLYNNFSDVVAFFEIFQKALASV